MSDIFAMKTSGFHAQNITSLYLYFKGKVEKDERLEKLLRSAFENII